jgi:hypothetical protein
MARYYPISPLFWSDSEVRQLDAETKLLALYLLTSEHRNLEGLYRLPLPYIQADLGWSSMDVDVRMAALEERGFLSYDFMAEVVLVRKALKYHQPLTDKQIQGAINALQEVPDTSLWDDFVEAANRYAPKLADRLGMPSESHPEPIT